MKTGGRVALVGAVVCALGVAGAPVGHATGGALSGTYDVMRPNTLLDTWTLTPQCAEVAAGCISDVHSPVMDGQAVYLGANTWVMMLRGMVPVCPDKSKTKDRNP